MQDQSTHQSDNNTLAYLMLILIRRRRDFIRPIILAGVLGIVIAIIIPRKYTASALFIRESVAEPSGLLGGGLAALQGIGLNIGGTASGLTIESYPDIVRSRNVQMAVLKEPIAFSDPDSDMTMVEYLESKSNTFFSRLIKYALWLTSKFPGNDPTQLSATRQGLGVPLTKPELIARRWIQEHTSVTVDRVSGIMSIAIVSESPNLSYQLVRNYLKHLAERIKDLNTKKLRDNVAFINGRFNSAKRSLAIVEEDLAEFSDHNRNPDTQMLRTEIARYQRQVDFASQLYSELQAQLTQSEIELQRSQAILTILEAPLPPVKPSGPGRKLIVLVVIFLGIVIASTIILLEEYYYTKKKSDADPAVLEIIKMIRWGKSKTSGSDPKGAIT